MEEPAGFKTREPGGRNAKQGRGGREAIEKARLATRVEGFERYEDPGKLTEFEASTSGHAPEAERFDKDFSVVERHKRETDRQRHGAIIGARRQERLDREEERWQITEQARVYAARNPRARPATPRRPRTGTETASERGNALTRCICGQDGDGAATATAGDGQSEGEPVVPAVRPDHAHVRRRQRRRAPQVLRRQSPGAPSKHACAVLFRFLTLGGRFVAQWRAGLRAQNMQKHDMSTPYNPITGNPLLKIEAPPRPSSPGFHH